MSKWVVEIDGRIMGYVWSYTQVGAIMAAKEKWHVSDEAVICCYEFDGDVSDERY